MKIKKLHLSLALIVAFASLSHANEARTHSTEAPMHSPDSGAPTKLNSNGIMSLNHTDVQAMTTLLGAMGKPSLGERLSIRSDSPERRIAVVDSNGITHSLEYYAPGLFSRGGKDGIFRLAVGKSETGVSYNSYVAIEAVHGKNSDDSRLPNYFFGVEPAQKSLFMPVLESLHVPEKRLEVFRTELHQFWLPLRDKLRTMDQHDAPLTWPHLD